jgi:hypothetical protein
MQDEIKQSGFPCPRCGAVDAVDADAKCHDVQQGLAAENSVCPVEFECVVMD